MALTQLKRTKREEQQRCLACEPVRTMERPRFFAGQLLTEAELNSQQAYVIAKNRLQNRYLHGVGVVCGLKVVCDDCKGVVTVEPGYALDPCGNDILVNEPHDFDVIDAIKECRRRERRRPDCEPWQPPRPRTCDDELEHWCLVIRYKEVQKQPVSPVLRARNKCNGASTTASATCEPTRIQECYELDVIRAPDACACGETRLDRSSLLGPLVECVRAFASFLAQEQERERFSQTQLAQAIVVASVPNLPPNWNHDTAYSLYRLCGDLWCFVEKLYRENPLGVDLTHCSVFEQLMAWQCQPPPTIYDDYGDDEAAARMLEYFERLRRGFRGMVDLIFDYLVDCICGHLLPPCPPEETEDYLILACLTVDDDRLLRIGNWCCRRHAGSFPALNHWFSLVPVLPALVERLKNLCCDPDLLSLFGRGVRGVSNDVVANNYFVAQSPVAAGIAGRASQARRSVAFSADDMLRWLGATAEEEKDGQTVTVVNYVNRPQDEVEEALAEKQVEVVYRDVSSETEMPVTDAFTAPAIARSGERVIAYRTPDNRIVGFRRYNVAEELERKEGELNQLRDDVGALRAEIEALKNR